MLLTRGTGCFDFEDYHGVLVELGRGGMEKKEKWREGAGLCPPLLPIVLGLPEQQV